MHAYAFDFLWLANHPNELHELYGGQWLAIVDDHIVASGTDGRTVYRQARCRHPHAEIMLEIVTEQTDEMLSMA